MHLALARKYRPQNFLELIGQDPVVQTLRHAIEQDRLHHAYLFCGVRGVGKTSMARILAKSINCEQGPTITPCLECESCKSIAQGNSLDVIEIDGASHNLVDDIRELREQVKFLPSSGQYKIYIIDEVHMLSNSAFNALLKTLEEPPAHIKFIFATTEAHKIPLTILSRCQKYDFRKLNTSTLLEHLKGIAQKESIAISDEALHVVAQCAQGSVRDALSLFDQIIDLSSENITEEQVRQQLGLADRVVLQEALAKILSGDLTGSLAALNEADNRGYDLQLFCEGLLTQYRHLILLSSTGQAPSDLSPSEVEFFTPLKDQADLSLLLAQYQILLKDLKEIAVSEFAKTVAEVSFVKLNHAQNMIGLADLVDQIKNKRPAKSQPVVARANPQAPVQTPLKTGNLDWRELVQFITNSKPPLGNLLKEAVPITVSKERIEVGLPQGSPQKSMLIERVSVVEQMLSEHLGYSPRFAVSDLTQEKKKP